MKEYLDLLERCGATFVQAAVATISGNSFLEMGVSNWKLVVASGFAAVLSVLKGWAATKLGIVRSRWLVVRLNLRRFFTEKNRGFVWLQITLVV